MLRVVRAIGVGFALVCITGCSGGSSGPTLDCDSQAAYDASVDAMADSLSPVDQDRFARALIKLAFEMPPVDVEAPTNADVYKPLHGLTAQEIIEKAQLTE